MTIGFLTAEFDTGYGQALLQGLREASMRKGTNLLVYIIGVVKSRNLNHLTSNVVLDLIDGHSLDGLIINVATVFHYLDKDEIEDFYRTYVGVPFVDIGFQIADHSMVVPDNKRGITDCVSHLITEHGFKKMAFIKGPAFNVESALRYEAFVETLEQYGIAPEPALVEEGGFDAESGAACFERIWKKNPAIDAVVASNDAMAFGVMRKAEDLGITIPNELAVTGFDDIAEAARTPIPLTTVCQPLAGMASRALDMVVDLVEGRECPRRAVMATELIVRKSCGCLSQRFYNARLSDGIMMQDRGTGTLDTARGAMLAGVHAALVPHPYQASAAWPEKLVDSFLDYVAGKAADLSAIDEELNKAIARPNFPIDAWQDALSALVTAAFPCLRDKDLSRAESFWQRARVLFQEAGTQSQSYALMQSELASEARLEADSELMSSFDLDQLVQSMARMLPRLGVTACYMSLFGPDAGQSGYSPFSFLVLGCNGEAREEIPPQGIRFPTRRLVPEGLATFDGLRDFIVVSLYFQRELLGFMLLRADPSVLRLESLRQQVGSTLKGALLVREVSEKEEKLRAVLAEQRERARELESAYKSLKENQEKMLIIEKMASLGRMTAGIAHEMNTPLAVVRNVLAEVETLAKEYERSIGDPEVTIDDHKEIAGDMERFITVGKKAAERAASFIQSVKSQTTGLTPQDRRVFDAIPVVQDAILLLSHVLKKSGCSVNFSSVTGRVDLFGSGARLSQVLVNLINNSVDAYKAKGGGPIEVSLRYEKDGIALTVSDKGSGIAKDIMPKIFDPLFTTKPFAEGTGLGLTIVRDIVTGEFGGAVEIQSEEGVGTTFELRLPKAPQGAAHA